jgi:hypothetical protein
MNDMILKPPGQAGHTTKGYSLLDKLKLPKAHHAQILVCTRLLLVYAHKLLSFWSENCQKNRQSWFRPQQVFQRAGQVKNEARCHKGMLYLFIKNCGWIYASRL